MAPHCHVRLWYNFISGYLLPRSRFYVQMFYVRDYGVAMQWHAAPLILWPKDENVETASRSSYHLLMETDSGGNRGRLYTHHYRQGWRKPSQISGWIVITLQMIDINFLNSVSLKKYEWGRNHWLPGSEFHVPIESGVHQHSLKSQS